MKKLVINGISYGDYTAYRQCSDSPVPCLWFAMSIGIEIKVPLYMIKHFWLVNESVALCLYEIESLATSEKEV